ncbi:nucleoplasmin-like protein ANO39 isoform X1 [Gymnodraco acuticeps]|uniref:Nucleoplasmin-like protein ANO39 isoform X1 n=1 Tax=Gymnodraco acuticeps TaxID=8218 RepID=A0A6P8VLJ7_GYMAC|nr:nucleoplasmin-like protein ANO39 isoform X1 [Gymnodraco acuticeps]
MANTQENTPTQQRDMVEDAVKKALGKDDKDEDKEDKEGGFFSKIFDRDDDEEKRRKLREREREKEKEDDEGFFSKIFHRGDDDDDDEGREKKSGFSGLFSELEGPPGGTGEQGGGTSVGINDGDLLSDLMEVAEETSKGN